MRTREPANCVCRRVGDLIEIATPKRAKLYRCRALTVGYDDAEIVGYRLVEVGKTEGYDVCIVETPWVCNCGDAIYRHRPCKHVIAVRELC